MFSQNQLHLFIRDIDIYFTKTKIINCITKYNFGEIYDCSILPGTTKFTNNVIIYIKKWGSTNYSVSVRNRLTNGKSIKIYYDNMDCWKATSFDSTKNVSLKLRIASNIAEILSNIEQIPIIDTNTNTTSLPSCDTTLKETYIEINYGDCHKILPPRRRVCKKNISK